MADNTNLPGSGELIALDELTTINGGAATAGLKVQRVKIGTGVDGDFKDVSSTDPIPVSAAALPLPTGAATETSLAGVRTDLGTDGATPPAVLGAGTGVRGWLRSIYEKLTGTLAVTGTFFQATQPVSIAATVAVSGPLTDAQLRAAAVPTSLAVLPASAAAADATANPTVTQVGALNQVFNGTTWDRLRGDVVSGARVARVPVTPATTLSTANTGVTLTLAVPGAGLFHYITRIRITNHNVSAAAVTGSAVTLAYTSTNIVNSLAWTEGNALAAGASKTVVDETLSNPIKSTTANTATTIVAPAAGAGVVTRITAYFYTGP